MVNLVQSFELETAVPGVSYTNAGTDGSALAADTVVDIMNIAGQPIVDSTAASDGTLGFNAEWVNTRGGVGLSDGDFIGVTSFTGDVGSFTDGSQGYQFSDPDGLLRLTFDVVDLTAAGETTIMLDRFINSTDWEAGDFVRIYVVTDVGVVDLLDTRGLDIDDLGIEGSFDTLMATLPASQTSAQLVVELDSNSSSESLYIDNVSIQATSGIVISEIMFNPASSEDDWEWVELHNPSGSAIDLAGYVLDDSNGVAHPSANIASGNIPAGGSAVLYNADDLSAADFEAAWGTGINLVAVTNWGAGQLNNGGDTVGLWSSFADYTGDNETQSNALVSVTYPNIDDGAGSIYLTDLADQDSWALSTDGTPTPVGTTITSTAAGGNSGSDIGSPGESPALPGIVYQATYVLDINELGQAANLEADGHIVFEQVLPDFLPTGGFVGSDPAPNRLEFTQDDVVSVSGDVAPVDIAVRDGGFPVFANVNSNTQVQNQNRLDVNFDLNGNGVFNEAEGDRFLNDIGLPGFNANIGQPGSTTVDLQNSRGTLTLLVAEQSTYDVAPDNAVRAEGDTGTTGFTFLVTRSGGTTAETTVLVSTVDGTATAGSDYTALADQVVTFAPGETEQVVTVQVNGDEDIEDDETFSLEITEASLQGIIGTASAEATIQNDDVDLTLISAVQGGPGTFTTEFGRDDASPLFGQTVTVQAIVVGDFQDGDADTARDLEGFFIQEEDADADGDPLTSEGIFVNEGGDFITDVEIGDLVTVTGLATERFGRTVIDATTVTIETAGNPLPTAAEVSLPTANAIEVGEDEFIADLEQFENMLVEFPDALTLTEYFNLDRFNEVVLFAGDEPGERPFQFTQTNAPDEAGFDSFQEDLATRTIVYGDGLSVQNADIGLLDGFGPVFSTATDIRGGDTITGLTGVLDFSFGDYQVRAVEDGSNTFDKVNQRPDTPDDVGGTLTVASFNVLNYFTTIDDGTATVATGLDPRGADDLTRFDGTPPASDDPNAEFERQTEKLVEQLLTIDADVLGLIELENDFMEGSPGNALETLVEELNVEAGAGTYDWVRPVAEDGSMPQSVGTDAIMQGIIYKPAEVSLVGDSAFLVFEEASAATTFALADVLNQFASSNDQVGDFQRNRPAIAATFEDNETGETFTVAVNHFKSKGDSNLEDVIGDAMGMADQADIDALIADPNFDQGDGAAFWNQVRVDAAEELVAWLESDPTNSGDPDYIILGDLNAYAQEEPVTTIEALGYTDLAEQFVGDDGYSFVFDGQLGTLDYALANASLTAQVTGATEWHVNVDEPDAIDYNLDFGRDASIFDGTVPFRASDHDPIIVGLDLESGPVTPPADEFEELPLFAFADDDGARFQVGGGSIGGLLFNFVGSDQLRITNESVNDSTPTFTTVKNYDVNNDQIILEEGVEITSVLPGFGGTTIIKFNGKGLFGLGDTLTVVSNNGFTADVLDTIVREGDGDSVYEAPTPSRTVDLETGIINTFGFQSFIDFWF